MPYSAEISRAHPTCFLLMVDQSTSMHEPFGGHEGKPKSEGVADAINRLLQNLAIKCAKADGIRDYFYVGLIGYGENVGPIWAGSLMGHNLVPISAVANNPLRVETRTRKVDDGAGGLIEQSFKFPVWVEPIAKGKTPMCAAFELAKTYLELFIRQNPKSYPPLVINLTDGRPSDADPRPAAKAIRELETEDGHVLMFNAHLSSSTGWPIEYPAADTNLPDDFARLLFRMSSVLPPKLLEAARAERFPVTADSRGFVFNADLVSVIRFIDLGTRPFQPAAGKP